jgi:hypothetical protein
MKNAENIMLKTFVVVGQHSHIKNISILISLVLSLLFMSAATAHGVDVNTNQFLQANQGVAIGPFLYIGAKHMVTGYDHLSSVA